MTSRFPQRDQCDPGGSDCLQQERNRQNVDRFQDCREDETGQAVAYNYSNQAKTGVSAITNRPDFNIPIQGGLNLL